MLFILTSNKSSNDDDDNNDDDDDDDVFKNITNDTSTIPSHSYSHSRSLYYLGRVLCWAQCKKVVASFCKWPDISE